MKTTSKKYDPEDEDNITGCWGDDDEWEDHDEPEEEPLEDIGPFDREWDEG